MPTPKWLRSQAARGLKLANEAKEAGNTGIAGLLTDAAARDLEAAQKLETPTTEASTSVQQQQQAKPKAQD